MKIKRNKRFINILTHKDGNKLGKRKVKLMIKFILQRAF